MLLIMSFQQQDPAFRTFIQMHGLGRLWRVPTEFLKQAQAVMS